MKRFLFTLFSLAYVMAWSQPSPSFQEIRLFDNGIDSMKVIPNAAKIRYDKVTGKIRIWDDITGVWYSPRRDNVPITGFWPLSGSANLSTTFMTLQNDQNFAISSTASSIFDAYVSPTGDGHTFGLFSYYDDGVLPVQQAGFFGDIGNVSGSLGAGLFFLDERAVTRGLQYHADYSSGFTARSFIDKGYADTRFWPFTGSGTLTGSVDISGAFPLSFGSTTPLSSFIGSVVGSGRTIGFNFDNNISIGGYDDTSGAGGEIFTDNSSTYIHHTDGTYLNFISVTDRIQLRGNGLVPGTSFVGIKPPSANVESFAIYTNGNSPILRTGESGGERYIKFDIGSDATGDIWYRNSSGNLNRLGIGSNGQYLSVSSGLPSWQSISGFWPLTGSFSLTGSVSISNAGGGRTYDLTTSNAGVSSKHEQSTDTQTFTTESSSGTVTISQTVNGIVGGDMTAYSSDFTQFGSVSVNNQSASIGATSSTDGVSILVRSDKIKYDFGDVERNLFTGRVTTTDNTLTTVKALSLSTAFTHHTVIVSGYLVAERTGGTSGSTGDAAGYKFEQLYKNVSGTVTQVGAGGITVLGEDQAGWDFQINISTTQLLFQVQGATDNNVTWNLSELKVMPVRPNVN